MRYLIKNIKLSKLLISSANILKEINENIEQDFSSFKFRDELIFEFNRKGYSDVFKKNFSIFLFDFSFNFTWLSTRKPISC